MRSCFVLLLFTLACTPDLQGPEIVRDLRILAVQAEPPEASIDLQTGAVEQVTVRILAVHWAAQVSDVELIYHVRTGEHVERVVQAFPMRWFTPAELAHLVARAGFRLEAMHGGFDRRSLTDDAPEIVVVAAAAD